jgi:hypothetical protein
MKISTGLVIIPVERDGENVGSIRFNPNDIGFAQRFYDLLGEFETKQQEFSKRAENMGDGGGLDEYGLPKNAGEQLALYHEICDFMKAKINELFGSGTSKTVFGDAVVLDMFADFFEGVTPYIQQARGDKIAKYTKSGKKNVMK